jgi:hypothetical protein
MDLFAIDSTDNNETHTAFCFRSIHIGIANWKDVLDSQARSMRLFRWQISMRSEHDKLQYLLYGHNVQPF